jgi:hypothetical protein
MRKQKTNTLPIMRPSDRLRQRRTNIHNPQPITHLYLPLQWHSIRNHHSTQLALIKILNRIPAQNPMCNDSYDLPSFVSHDGLGGFDECAAGISHVVDEDGDLVLDVADKYHAADFVRARALFVDEGEAEVEAVGD